MDLFRSSPTKRPNPKRPSLKTPQIQNILRHKVPATKCPNYKISQLQKDPSLKKSQPQNVLNQKHPCHQNVPSLKKQPNYKQLHVRVHVPFISLLCPIPCSCPYTYTCGYIYTQHIHVNVIFHFNVYRVRQLIMENFTLTQ